MSAFPNRQIYRLVQIKGIHRNLVDKVPRAVVVSKGEIPAPVRNGIFAIKFLASHSNDQISPRLIYVGRSSSKVPYFFSREWKQIGTWKLLEETWLFFRLGEAKWQHCTTR